MLHLRRTTGNGMRIILVALPIPIAHDVLMFGGVASDLADRALVATEHLRDPRLEPVPIGAHEPDWCFLRCEYGLRIHIRSGLRRHLRMHSGEIIVAGDQHQVRAGGAGVSRIPPSPAHGVCSGLILLPADRAMPRPFMSRCHVQRGEVAAVIPEGGKLLHEIRFVVGILVHGFMVPGYVSLEMVCEHECRISVQDSVISQD